MMFFDIFLEISAHPGFDLAEHFFKRSSMD